MLQRQLSRKVKFSANWQKQEGKIQRHHLHIANIRRDYLRKVTSQIIKNHAMIVTEDLKVGNMPKSAKGTSEQPGRNVRAKSGLNLAIPPAYASQRCTYCDHTAKENRQTQSKFVCHACGYTENTYINGARNILAAGQAVPSSRGMVQSTAR